MSDEAILPPNPSGLLGEGLGFLEVPRLLFNSQKLARQPRGAGECVMVLPGYGANDGSTSILRGYLRYLGYRPVGWGLGRNNGEVPELLPRVIERLEEASQREGKPISMVGWSLGGVLAREAARERPGWVRQVITLGSPVVGGPKYTAVAEAYRRRGIDLDAIEREVAARNDHPLQTPVTAIYSRRDGVVAWKACIDHHARRIEHVEVETTHLGLGFSTEVFCLIASRLAQPRNQNQGGPQWPKNPV